MRGMQHRPLATGVLLAVSRIAHAATTSLERIGARHSGALRKRPLRAPAGGAQSRRRLALAGGVHRCVGAYVSVAD